MRKFASAENFVWAQTVTVTAAAAGGAGRGAGGGGSVGGACWELVGCGTVSAVGFCKECGGTNGPMAQRENREQHSH